MSKLNIRRYDVAIVVYHHIGDNNDSLIRRLGLSITPENFERHVRYFKRNFDFVSAADIISGPLPRKAILVTFDDAYRSVIEVAGPILKAVNAPSLFFVCASPLISDYTPIDNILSLAIDELGLGRVLSITNREKTITNSEKSTITSIPKLLTNVFSAMTASQITAVRHRLLSAMGTSEGAIRRATNIFMDAAAVRNASQLGIEIGNHSKHHSFFRSLSQSELHTEIVEGRAILQELTGQPIQYLSIPYGNKIDASSRVLELARASGHKAIFLVHGKSNRFPMASDVFYRSHLGNASHRSIAFRLRFMPIARTVRDVCLAR